MIDARTETLEIDLPNPAATQALARRLAALARRGDVIALRGDLGAGKTTFARAFILGRDGGSDVAEVPSPTFTLVQVYDLPSAPVWHFDLYRLTAPEQVWELGFEEALASAITLIEWPERLGALLPERRLDVALAQCGDPEARRVGISATGSWRERLARITADA